MKHRIGIGIITRNRHDLIKTCVSNVVENSLPHKLIVVDDASDTPVKLDNAEVFRFKKRSGIASAKNKCLEYLDDCDYIFLFDDDCWPTKKGWETIYIDASKKTGNQHFCFNWEKYHDDYPSFASVKERFVDKVVTLKTEGFDDIILPDNVDDTHERMVKVRNYIPANTPSVQETDVKYSVNSYDNSFGVMLFFTRKCLNRVGGFHTHYGIYGHEHIGLSHRIHNAGLTPFGVFLDVENSEEFFYAKDRIRNSGHESVLTHSEKISLPDTEKELHEEMQSSDYVKYKENDKMKKVAILVVSHNYKELTDSLCENIIKRTKGVDYDLHVIETGSNLSKVSSYMTLWVKEGVRMTRGFNLLKEYADFTAKMKGYEYDAYHLFVNDANFIDDQDMTAIMYNEMMANPDCGQINPYQRNIGPPHMRQNKMNQSGARKESFSEIICPMIRATTWNEIPDLLDNRFFYGWGLDYDVPHRLHTNNWRLYITDTVGVHHQAFTSYREKEKTEEKLHVGEFMGAARQNMNDGFISKYGADWRNVIFSSVPADVNPESLFNWLHYNDGFNPTKR